jgi:hypothetical protein
MTTARSIYRFARRDRYGRRMARVVLVGVVIVLAVALPPMPATALALALFGRLHLELRRNPLTEAAR